MQVVETLYYKSEQLLKFSGRSDSVRHVLHGEEEANARRATTQSQDSTAKRGQFRSGFSSEVTQKTTLTEKQAKAVKKPQSDVRPTAEISDTPRTDEGCRT